MAEEHRGALRLIEARRSFSLFTQGGGLRRSHCPQS